ncbi:MAG: hypothetical protein EBZ83_01645 [Verrucomicrobia bacterium]|nr:hypothetical protein [Verrucomicrobiota bacterium]
MPCVFPVLSLKALHLVQLSGESRGSARTEGFAYTAGVVLSLLALAALLIVLPASGSGKASGPCNRSPANGPSKSVSATPPGGSAAAREDFSSPSGFPMIPPSPTPTAIPTPSCSPMGTS